MELGKNIAGVIATQQNEYMGQIRNVFGAMEMVRDKFTALYQEVTLNRQGLMQCAEGTSTVSQRLGGFQQAGDHLGLRVDGLKRDLDRVNSEVEALSREI